MRRLLCLLCLPLLAAQAAQAQSGSQQSAQHFSVREAIEAEWARQPLLWTETQKAALPAADRARLELTIRRIGSPGTPALLPPELARPTVEVWEAKATAAHTPQERFTALFFLNRLKSPKALLALEGLGAPDAATWPKQLSLEASLATARVNGAVVSSALTAFLDGLSRAHKVDPTRAQAARLRLMLAGLEERLLPPIPTTPGSVLALMDAVKAAPDEGRKRLAQQLRLSHARDLGMLGLQKPTGRMRSAPGFQTLEACFQARLALLEAPDPEATPAPPPSALHGPDPIARAAVIEALPAVPADLETLTRIVWQDSQFEAQQALIQGYARWQLPEGEQKAQLRPWLTHPDWACRWEAYQALLKLEPDTPWPTAPQPTKLDAAILNEAAHLAERGRPIRLRLTFSRARSVTLRLDPTVAPMNVANLVLLARKGYFNGRLVPRVVPDFVVQMGSPFDTMDGGPGYTVRCENSLHWYGPGSVGMALAGKDTGGSQFFITTNATPHLTGKYTRLGEVEDPERALKLLDELELGAKLQSIKVLKP